ncbi:MAG: hypothetical protein ACFFCE_00610 [Promethearchaeota archaeon]
MNKNTMKKESLQKIFIIIADRWKLNFYSKFMSILDETKNQGEIMKRLMIESEFKKHSKIINQSVNKILKNVGKYPKLTLTTNEEFHSFDEIKPVLEKKFNSKVEIMYEQDSKEQKAANALPGKPAIVIF